MPKHAKEIFKITNISIQKGKILKNHSQKCVCVRARVNTHLTGNRHLH